MPGTLSDKDFYQFKTDIALTRKCVSNIEKLIEKQTATIKEQGNQIDVLLRRVYDLESKMKTISYLAGVLIAIIIPILIAVVVRFFGI
jgi:hypothetical protein